MSLLLCFVISFSIRFSGFQLGLEIVLFIFLLYLGFSIFVRRGLEIAYMEFFFLCVKSSPS
jgi:hypothetical protein